MKKNTSNKTNSFTSTEVGVLIEEFRSEFKVFGDGLVFVRDRVDALDKKVDRIDKRVEILDIKVTKIGIDVADIQNILKNHDGRLSKVEAVITR